MPTASQAVAQLAPGCALLAKVFTGCSQCAPWQGQVPWQTLLQLPDLPAQAQAQWQLPPAWCRTAGTTCGRTSAQAAGCSGGSWACAQHPATPAANQQAPAGSLLRATICTWSCQGLLGLGILVIAASHRSHPTAHLRNRHSSEGRHGSGCLPGKLNICMTELTWVSRARPP